ncbi:MAG: hypothetical protein K2Q13_05650 [Nitrosomonas sp.]|uniref:hypothetical protein n=1 Tax=Nitrosomonas sp. TaxID=42353 RepID=UPI0025D27005|nr:hypothetical protein [Nitrosomonas sp.]MBY0474533.1 hypothetical protein [Nitrosomonas sp.]
MHILTTLAKMVRPGGARAIVADSLLIKHQPIPAKGSNLTVLDRFLFTFRQWHANLRILEIDEIKTVPQVPIRRKANRNSQARVS